MNARDFCYWLQSAFELCDAKSFDEQQTATIKKHLDMVFVHDLDQQFPSEVQKKLNEIHNPTPQRPNNGWQSVSGTIGTSFDHSSEMAKMRC